MFLVPAWHNKDNRIDFYDETFEAFTDEYELLFIHKKICSRFKISVDNISTCESVISIYFALLCQIPAGVYIVTLINSSLDEELCTLDMKIYKNPNTCLTC